jgi:uncharacterized protein
MGIPSKQQCMKLMCEMKMMDHIAAHSIRVCQVATFLTDHLNGQAGDLDRNRVQAAALCHDITKTRSFETGENHADTAMDLLRDLGHPEVSRIVGQHVRLDAYGESDVVSEAEIINYSDKRVLHDRVVSLADRFDYIMEKYAKNEGDRERILFLTGKTEELGQKIFGRLPFAPDTLSEHLDPDVYTSNLEAYHIQLNIH